MAGVNEVKVDLKGPEPPKGNEALEQRIKLFELPALDMPAVNPLSNETRDDLYEKSKLYFFGPLMMIVRLPVVLVCLIFIVLFASLSVWGFDIEAKEPLPRWRRWLQAPIPFFGRIFLFIGGYYWISVKGKPAPDHEAPLYCINHTCFMDPVYMAIIHMPAAVSRKEQRDTPIIGPVFDALQVLYIDRRSQTSKKDIITQVKNRAADALSSNGPTPDDGCLGANYKCWPKVMIYPEGTCFNQQALGMMKIGSFIPGVPIQPVIINYPFSHFDMSWVSGGPQMLGLIYRVFCQFINYMTVEFVEPYVPSEEEKKNPKLFADNFREYMAAAAKVPTVDCEYDDVFFQQELEKNNCQSKANARYINIEYGKVKYLAGIRRFYRGELEEYAQIWAKYANRDVDQNYSITFDSYLANIKSRIEESKRDGCEKLARATFDLMCRGEEELNIRYFVYCFTMLDKATLTNPETFEKQFRETRVLPALGYATEIIFSLIEKMAETKDIVKGKAIQDVLSFSKFPRDELNKIFPATQEFNFDLFRKSVIANRSIVRHFKNTFLGSTDNVLRAESKVLTKAKSKVTNSPIMDEKKGGPLKMTMPKAPAAPTPPS